MGSAAWIALLLGLSGLGLVAFCLLHGRSPGITRAESLGIGSGPRTDYRGRPDHSACPHWNQQMRIADVGTDIKGRYGWIVCLDCNRNLTGGPIRLGDAPESGWRA